ncbi:MAG: hypothetical protein AB8B96_04745 [Lysobacterales bacterium]
MSLQLFFFYVGFWLGFVNGESSMMNLRQMNSGSERNLQLSRDMEIYRGQSEVRGAMPNNKTLQYVPAASGLHPTGFAGG